MAFKSKKNKLSRSEGIVYHTANSGTREAFNRLRDNILSFGIDGKNKIIQFESSIMAESKTTTLANTAVALAASGYKVLAVDLDFRRSRLHHAFHIENKEGISDYLLGNIEKEKIIKKTKYDNAFLITRGSRVENTAALLTSEKFSELMESLKNDYDFILLDCPPVLVISDFIHIARISCGVVFVIAYNKTKKRQVRDAILTLKRNNVNIIGSVFTFFDPKQSNDYSEYVSYSYSGYYEDANKKD